MDAFPLVLSFCKKFLCGNLNQGLGVIISKFAGANNGSDCLPIRVSPYLFDKHCILRTNLRLLRRYHSVSDPSPRNDQCPAGSLFANQDTRVESAIHSVSLSLYLHYDVIEHRHEDNSSLELFKFAHFVHELLDFLDELQ